MIGNKTPNRPRNKRDQRKRKGNMINGYSLDDAFRAINSWMMDPDNMDFDDSFVKSLEEQYEEKESLSERQEQALRNIINNWKIDIGANL